MLQGNPFETEQWAEERRETVQHGVKQHRRPRTAQDDRKMQGWELPSTAHIHRRVRLWWLPAALAFGILLRFITGG